MSEKTKSGNNSPGAWNNIGRRESYTYSKRDANTTHLLQMWLISIFIMLFGSEFMNEFKKMRT